eukprot:TRINITY_DN1080_c0_g1_i1.p1 TRINITY_DN1080_c0_g1~~TRINITY_DN1080_c0_g1_i1.p1  ORF type:complete len:533 (-),score=118.14 TRINITY_DN1080_c0_g1_i1:54-1652(-)
MNIKILSILIGLSVLVKHTTAHIYLSSVNGNDEFDAIRPERPNGDRNAPITNVNAGDMTCGWLPYASNPANRALPVTAGSNITLQYWHDGPGASDIIIESSHRGPCIMYMAANPVNGQDPAWFKIWEYGLDSSNKFCVDYLQSSGINAAGRGRISLKIPSYLPTGKYILRSEIIALHQGDVIGGAQFYVNCVELSVTNPATTGLVSISSIPTVKFPGTYSSTDAGIYYNLYQYVLPAYIVPGPSVFQPSSPSSPVTTAPVPSTPATQTPSSPVNTAPITAPTTTDNYIKIQIHPAASTWWPAFKILGSSENTTKVEFQGSGTFKKGWTTMSLSDYGYWIFSTGTITLPLSLRLTSVSGSVVELDEIITALVGGSIVSTKVQYGSTAPIYPTPPPVTTSVPTIITPTSTPTSTPTPIAPTPTPTSKAATNSPTTTPATIQSTVKLSVHPGSSQWWFAVAVSGNKQSISYVEVKDSNPNSQYVQMNIQTWGYWVSQTGELVPPLTVRISSSSGASLTIPHVPETETTIDSGTYF